LDPEDNSPRGRKPFKKKKNNLTHGEGENPSKKQTNKQTNLTHGEEENP
jgi:hypothetical protein